MEFKLFFSFLYRNLSEFLEILHKLKSGLAGTCTCSFVSLYELSLCVLLESGDLSVDFFNKSFHFFIENNG